MNIGRRARLFAIAVLSVLAMCATPTCAQHFYFAQMTDIHFGADDNTARAAKAVDDINRLPMKVECVVVTGDIFDENILDPKVVDTALGTLKQIKVPVHYVAGNNDIVEGDNVADGDRVAARREAFVKSFGPLASKAEHGGVVFLMVCAEPLRGDVKIPGYDPIKWLDGALKDSGDKPVIIFTHEPDDEDFWANTMHPGWPKESRDRWEALIKSHGNVKAVITGHFHRDELHWIGSVPEFVCAPVASHFGRQNTYRVYEYTDGKIGYRTVYLN